METSDLKKIESQKQLNSVFADFGESDDIFVKEIVYDSPTNVLKGFIVAPDSLGTLRVLLINPEGPKGLILSIEDVEKISLHFGFDTLLSGIFTSENSVSIKLGYGGSIISGRNLSYRMFDFVAPTDI